MMLTRTGKLHSQKTDAIFCVAGAFIAAACLPLSTGGILKADLFAGHGVLVAMGWVNTFSIFMPALLFSKVLQVPLRAVVSLDPKASGDINKLLHQAIPVFRVVGLLFLPGFLMMAAASGSQHNFAGASLVLAGAGLGNASMAVLCALLAQRLDKLPTSAVCYLQTFPSEARQFRLVRFFLKQLGIGQAINSLPFLLAPVVLQPYMGTVLLVGVAGTQPVLMMASALALRHYWFDLHKGRLHNKLQGMNEPDQAMQQQLREALEKRGVTESASVAERGVSLEFLQTFAAAFAVQQHETIEDVCNRVVKPLTSDDGCSLWSILHETKSADGHKHWIGKFVHLYCTLYLSESTACEGKNMVFITHGWSCTFLNLLNTIEYHEAQHPEIDKYYYIDLFVLNQHMEGSITDMRSKSGTAKVQTSLQSNLDVDVQTFLLSNLESSIECAKLLLVATNCWDAPLPLTRIWCLVSQPPVFSFFYRYVSLCVLRTQSPVRGLEGARSW